MDRNRLFLPLSDAEFASASAKTAGENSSVSKDKTTTQIMVFFIYFHPKILFSQINSHSQCLLASIRSNTVNRRIVCKIFSSCKSDDGKTAISQLSIPKNIIRMERRLNWKKWMSATIKNKEKRTFLSSTDVLSARFYNHDNQSPYNCHNKISFNQNIS